MCVGGGGQPYIYLIVVDGGLLFTIAVGRVSSTAIPKGVPIFGVGHNEQLA